MNQSGQPDHSGGLKSTGNSGNPERPCGLQAIRRTNTAEPSRHRQRRVYGTLIQVLGRVSQTRVEAGRMAQAVQSISKPAAAELSCPWLSAGSDSAEAGTGGKERHAGMRVRRFGLEAPQFSTTACVAIPLANCRHGQWPAVSSTSSDAQKPHNDRLSVCGLIIASEVARIPCSIVEGNHGVLLLAY